MAMAPPPSDGHWDSHWVSACAWMHVLYPGVLFFFLQLSGYVLISSWLQYRYYFQDLSGVSHGVHIGSSPRVEKGADAPMDADQAHTVCCSDHKRSFVSWWPLLSLLFPSRDLPHISLRPHGSKHPRHNLYATINSFTSSAFAGTIAYAFHANLTWCRITTTARDDYTDYFKAFATAVAWQSVIEYYWHRLMHWGWIYKAFHKLHHTYQHPVPFDDLFIHPVEAMGYYLILYSPAFLPILPKIPLASFVAYMAVMGLCGVFDHSGVASLRIPGGIYETTDHANHHSRFVVNYAFPFPLMDIVHQTYYYSTVNKQK
ncbi:fatty acid hydroxylase domain-containing protein [Pycnococcus provasolii]